MDKEIWKVYKECYTNQYQSGKKRVYEVSNKGRVKRNGKIVEPYLRAGYPAIGGFRLHRAVAELFIPNLENKPCIDHINTITTDNRVENLRWVTAKENNNNPLTREHHSKPHKPHKPHKLLSEETKQKISDAIKGKHWKLIDGKRVWY